MMNHKTPQLASGARGVLLWAICATPAATARSAGSASPATVDFNRHIRPILADHCFACHGPDAKRRKAKLRLDTQHGAFALRDHGAAIVPGGSAQSELYRRITAENDEKRMPPPKTGKPLTKAEIRRLRTWIDQGAAWAEHWSLVPPVRPVPPSVENRAFVGNPVDRFVLAKLESMGLQPSDSADRVTLIRRLHFDLIGLPPMLEEVEAFVGDSRPDAYERLVDRLLASPRYGERMAIAWLDLVRYADTVGYHGDQERSISPYRDYVIDAFNHNMPFDRFTVEQLAGDLLPNAADAQKTAAGYNMLGMTTIEGGAQAKEYLAKYAADRVRTTAGVWLAATLGCAECHNHKYDPYTMEDFYSFAAFFADIQQKGVGNPAANLLLPTETQQVRLRELDHRVAEAERTVRSAHSEAEKKKDIARRDQLNRQRARLIQAIRKTIVPVSGEPRTMRVLSRGDWMDESGKVVTPRTPHFMRQVGGHGHRATRLDLAKWLVAPDQPLTARVFVNRLWKMYFGTGISRVLDDLGTQGEWPTHPALLDWLAVEFMESGWDVKHVVRLLVCSHTYRQSSQATPEMRRRDPANRLLAYQSRFRIEAELVRDNALAVSGLLVNRTGGNSAKPYQPAGYYAYLNFPKRKYHPSDGPDQYRRGVYTHWQRTFLHPMLLAFDAPSREACTAQRPISNTPLAALTLLNDPTFVEAARVFAERILTEGGNDTDARMVWAWRQVLSRRPDPRECALLMRLLGKQRARYAADAQAAETLLTVGRRPAAKNLPVTELAAWTSVARTLLNLSEAITRN